ncbi:MAG: hydrogenase small subunit [Desulfobacterales bacterium]|jgi:[NiFe] hydrogenase small subunit
MEPEKHPVDGLKQRDLTRRDFLKFCTVVAGAIGLGPAFGPKIAEALTSGQRPPVLWLHFAECTGCTEAVLRTTSPFFDDLLFDSISLDYHETLMAAAGARVESIRKNAANTYAGEFFCVVEGAIPTADGGIYGMVGGHTMLQIAQEICPKARAVIAIGTCGSYGGLAAASPNPTGAKGVKDALGSQLQVPVVNIPGCPPNPITFVGTLAHYLLPDKPLTLDSLGRPTFAYGARVHDQCPYRHDSQEHRCLEDYGCKGKRCHNNCPTEQFNDKTSWPVLAGHPCIGCSEPNFWDTMTPFYQEDEEHEEHDSYGGSGEYSREEEYDD